MRTNRGNLLLLGTGRQHVRAARGCAPHAPCAPSGPWLLALLPIALASCQPGLSQDERSLLLKSQELYETGDYGGASQRAQDFIARVGKRPVAAEAWYIRGLCQYRAGDAGAARDCFQRALELAGREDLVGRAQTMLGTLDYEQGRFEQAAENYEAAIERLPDEPPKDQVLYRLGVARQRQGQWEQAALAFSRLSFLFPGSPLAERARERFTARYFAVQVAAVPTAQAARQLARQVQETTQHEVSLEEAYVSGRIWYRVRVGQFKTYDEASTALANIRRTYRHAIIVP